MPYNRYKAVLYANRWWNSYNPAFPNFTVDCTNYVSQCIYAGGIQMRGYPDKYKGWWCENQQWSFSWSVAHSFYWFLRNNLKELNVIEVPEAKELYAGDVICYDFAGDSRWDHTVIVVGKDREGNPLVNAHTDNSYHRNWEYKDSLAWTPNIKYAFFHFYE